MRQKAIATLAGRLTESKILAVKTLTTSCFHQKEWLANSLADSSYSSPPAHHQPDSTDRPTSKDAGVRRVRDAISSAITAPKTDVLINSLSDGNYTSQPQRRRVLSSVSDPDTSWVGSSLSDGYYEVPAALRAGSRSLKHVRFFFTFDSTLQSLSLTNFVLFYFFCYAVLSQRWAFLFALDAEGNFCSRRKQHERRWW